MNKRAIRFILSGLIVLPFIVLASYSYYASYQDQTESIKARRFIPAQLSAVILTEKFDRLTDVGVSLSSREIFQNLIRRGQWSIAADTLRVVTRDFPYIDQIFLTDVAGTHMASFPEVPGALGEDLSFTDWYRGVTLKNEPYVSAIYQRSGVPQYDVIAVAVPVRAEDGRMLAILVLQIRVRTLADWIQSVTVGESGTVYFVDRKGQAARYSNYYSEMPAADYSRYAPVERIMKGKSGTGIFKDPSDGKSALVAYIPVSAYGWGVLVTEPEEQAFALRDKGQRSLLSVYAFLLLLNVLLVYVIWRSQNRLVAQEREMAVVHAEREQLELFAFVASHDLQEPLQKIMGFASLLKDKFSDALGEEGRRHLERIDRSAKYLVHMMEDIKQFSRVRKSGKFVPVDLGPLVKEVAAEFADRLEEIGGRIHVENLPEVQGYPSQLRHLFHNLIGNAVKFRKAGRPVEITVDSRRSAVGDCRITVHDNGIGFDEKYLDLIFTPFKRLHGKTEYEGSGMGLAICKKIVILHGGTITARSVPGEGSSFIVTLPCKNP